MSLLKLVKDSQNQEDTVSEMSEPNEAISPAPDTASISEQSEGPAPSLKGFGRNRPTSVLSMEDRNLSSSTNTSSKMVIKPAITLPKKRFENSYRTEPDPSVKFSGSKVKKYVLELLEMRLKTERYRARSCSSLTTSLADVIKAGVKTMGFQRHRIVVYVVVGEKRDQGMQTCGRCVWDEKADNFVTVTYDNASLFVIASVYGIYYE